MKNQEQFIEKLKTLIIPKAITNKWISNNFDLDNFRGVSSKRKSIASVELYGIFGNEKYSKQSILQKFKEFTDGFPEEAVFEIYVGEFGSQDEIDVSMIDYSALQDDFELIQELKDIIKHFIKDQTEYQQFIALKIKYEGLTNE